MIWYLLLRLAGRCSASSSSGLDGLPWSKLRLAVALPRFLVGESGVGLAITAAVVGVGAAEKIGAAGADVWVDGWAAVAEVDGWAAVAEADDWAGAEGDGAGLLGVDPRGVSAVLLLVCSAGAAGVVAGLVVVVWLETGMTGGEGGGV
ncbi:hypothetical protein V6N11_071511 [Hibiscus sabdariffa]|uniref:Uncharacterized protein n=1 Tax=Hibiscus sabdariffa TaxID=183260 RepID=A0ABR2U150_9ROSI